MIDYSILASSLEHYQKYGYNRIETPWTVTKAISDITKPSGAKDFSILEKEKVLVASGEQSFLYLYLKGFLPKGKFQTITPCFRDEKFDLIHTKYFMKCELIDTINVGLVGLIDMTSMGLQFFSKYLPADNLETINIGQEQIDIMYVKDDIKIELGSYGIRSCDYLTWVYGTGVAEPRLSTVIKMHKRN